VVDVMFWMAWAGAKVAQFFISDFVADLTGLTQLMAVSVNDANDDWIILCDVCPVEYCDNLATGLGAQTLEVDAVEIASWLLCAVTHTGDDGGTWTASEREGGNGAIVWVRVWPSGPRFGLSCLQACGVRMLRLVALTPLR